MDGRYNDDKKTMLLQLLAIVSFPKLIRDACLPVCAKTVLAD